MDKTRQEELRRCWHCLPPVQRFKLYLIVLGRDPEKRGKIGAIFAALLVTLYLLITIATNHWTLSLVIGMLLGYTLSFLAR